MGMVQHEWRRRVIPSCLGQAREAVKQLQYQAAQDVHAELEELGGEDTRIVLMLFMDEALDPDDLAAKALDPTWPAWRECLTE
jgi:hypothetical protein